MSTRDTAYQIFRKLNDEQLEGFIAMFRRFYPEEEEIAKKQTAFQSLGKLIRHCDLVDDDAELAAYREEKYNA